MAHFTYEKMEAQGRLATWPRTHSSRGGDGNVGLPDADAFNHKLSYYSQTI